MINKRRWDYQLALSTLAWVLLATVALADDARPPLTEIRVKSSIDGSRQPALVWAPESATKDEPAPLLVWLHSWSFDYRQKDALEYLDQARKQGWILLLPNFRGRNDNPRAGGSKLAQADILDAIDYVEQHFKVNSNRIYLAGGSGGGHMALLMAGYYPDRFSAVSSWVPITDLADWYRFHARPGGAERYAKGVLAVCGGAPGASEAIDAEYRARSPIFHLDKLEGLHLDIAAGVEDSSVMIAHSLNAFNRAAETLGGQPISSEEIEQLQSQGKLAQPRESDRVTDASYGCDILLRRSAGDVRVTIFQGGHVSLPEACCAWLAEQQRATKK